MFGTIDTWVCWTSRLDSFEIEVNGRREQEKPVECPDAYLLTET